MRFFRSLLLGAFAAASLASARAGAQAPPLVAQLTLPKAVTGASPGVRAEGAYATAPVTLDGVALFRIVAPATPAPGQLAVDVRASYVDAAFEAVLATSGTGARERTLYDPASLRVHLRREGDLALLEAIDAKHGDPLPLLTVTAVDARYYDTSVVALATDWQSRLQGALGRALRIRQPSVQRRTIGIVLQVATVLAALTVALWFAVAALRRRIARLSAAAAQREDAAKEGAAEVAGEGDDAQRGRRRVLAQAIVATRPARRLRFLRALASGLVWIGAFGWCGALVWALWQFPDSTGLAAALSRGALGVAIIVVVTAVFDRALEIAIDRIASAWRAGSSGSSDNRTRRLLRVPTIARALAGFKTFVLVFVASLAVLGQIGVPIGSVVTVGGLAAIALSLAAQNFVRDFLNGFLVLFEDQYVVGDYVTINGFSGSVELFTLRVVQVRDAAGNLITIPHSTVTSVVNQSREWSRVDYRVPVDPLADAASAIAVVRGAIEALANETAWRDGILDPVEWIGIDAITRDGMVVRASVKTAPLRQFELKRAINARVHADLAAAQIGFGLMPA